MNYLYKGSQSQERLNALLSFGKSTSEDIKAALSDYLVRGISKTNAATLNGVKGPNFTRALNRLEVVAGKFENALEIEWYSTRQNMKLELIKERIDALSVELNLLLPNENFSDGEWETHNDRIVKRLKLEINHIGTSKRTTENEYLFLVVAYGDTLKILENKDEQVDEKFIDCIDVLDHWKSQIPN